MASIFFYFSADLSNTSGFKFFLTINITGRPSIVNGQIRKKRERLVPLGFQVADFLPHGMRRVPPKVKLLTEADRARPCPQPGTHSQQIA